MHDAVDEHEPAGDLVEVDVLVEGQHQVDAELAELGDGVPQHEDQDEHGREVEALTWRVDKCWTVIDWYFDIGEIVGMSHYSQN